MNTITSIGRKKSSFKSICAGVLATVGIAGVLLGSSCALGFSKYLNVVSSNAATAAPALLFLFISLTIAMFGGAWVMGRLRGFHTAETAVVHGAAVWAVCAAVFAAGLGAWIDMNSEDSDAAESIPQNKQSSITAALDARSSAEVYNTLDDAALVNSIVQRAHEYKNKLDPDALNTSMMPETPESKSVSVVANRPGLQRVIAGETGMTPEQAREFIDAEQRSIAAQQARSESQWERTRSASRAQAQSARRSALVLGWSSAVAALVSLGAALSGAWIARMKYEFEG